MNRTYATELVRRLAPELKQELTVQAILPLEIKLHLERLRLMELISAACETKPRAAVLTPRPPKDVCIEKLERANGFEPSTLTLAT